MARLRITTLTGFIGTAVLFAPAMLLAAAAHNGAAAPTHASTSAPDLKTVIDKVENRYGGKVVEIEREHHGLYEVELLGEDGYEHEFHVNPSGVKVTKHPHGEY